MADAYKGLTIKFRADTTALSKALSTLRAEAKSAQASLSSVEKALKLDPSNVELLAQKEQYASQKAAALREKLDLVSRALSDGGVEKGSEAYNRLQRELVTTNDALGKAEAAASEARDALAGEAEAAEHGAEANAEFGSSADKVSKKALAITAAADKAGQALSNTLTPAVRQFASSSVQVAGDFESSMSQVSAALGGAGADTEALSSLAKEMGATTVFSANDAAGAMVELAKGGLTEAQIQSGALASAMDLAAAGGLGLSDAANTIVQAMGAFGLSAGETSRAANALAGSSGILDVRERPGRSRGRRRFGDRRARGVRVVVRGAGHSRRGGLLVGPRRERRSSGERGKNRRVERWDRAEVAVVARLDVGRRHGRELRLRPVRLFGGGRVGRVGGGILGGRVSAPLDAGQGPARRGRPVGPRARCELRRRN